MTDAGDGSRKHILIVEDDKDLRETLREALELEGYAAVSVENGRAALRHLANGAKPCLILLDLMMPVMDGYGFLAQRRLDPALLSIPLAIVTAGHGVDLDRLGDGLQILAKPFDVPQLVGVLHTLGSEGAPSA